jgi:hypothetical protein
MHNTKNTYRTIAIVFVLIVVLAFLFSFTPYAGEALTDTANRNLETLLKLWLNGYLGVFFNYKWVGILAVVFPIALFVFKPDSKNKLLWYVAIVLATVLTIIISTLFYINGRYQLTLYIIFTWVGIILLKKVIINEKNYFTLIFLFFSFNLLNTIIQGASDYLPRFEKKLEAIGKTNSLKSTNNYIQFLNDSVPKNSFFLVNNLPEFYYYTSLKGLYCWTFDNIYFNELGKHSLYSKENPSKTDSVIQEYHIQYFFTTRQFNAFNTDFQLYIESRSNIIFDDGHYIVYQIKSSSEGK